MATMNPEKELIELEQKYWNALQARDTETCLRLTDFPCIVTGPQGIGRVDKVMFETMMEEATYDIESYELSDMQVRMVSDDVAIVAYKVSEEMQVDGESVHLEAADSSTWIRRGKQWTCAAHAEALIGDAFGRDRRAS